MNTQYGNAQRGMDSPSKPTRENLPSICAESNKLALTLADRLNVILARLRGSQPQGEPSLAKNAEYSLMQDMGCLRGTLFDIQAQIVELEGLV